MVLQPEYHVTVGFLQNFEPRGPWCLTAIPVEQTKTRTETFQPGEEQLLLQWLERMGPEHNLYFAVNPVTSRLQKKATKGDVLEVRRFHVDVDPRAGEPLAEEQERIRKLLQQEQLPEGLPRPTWTLASGGGYQAFWELDAPLPLGTPETIEAAERFNKKIELVLGGDHCHNVDRVMRLPGTINWPNEKKRKAGRKPVLASVLEHRVIAYPVSAFQQAPVVQSAVDRVGFGGRTVRVSGNIKRVTNLDDLPPKVPAKCKIVIAQGHDPDEPSKHGSRSEWLWYTVCELVRSGVDDDTIYSIITDPDWPISGHVLAQKSAGDRYALRQIERAKDYAIDPWLQKLNDLHAVISDIGGKCLVIAEVFDEGLGRFRLTRQAFADFKNRYSNVLIEIGTNAKGVPLTQPLGAWWLAHRNRRQFDKLVFAPGRDVEGSYNLWRGYGVEPAAGDCTKFLAHVREVVCSGNQEHYDYLIRWMANAVQHPDRPGQVAVVLKGKMGAGKGTFAKTFGSLFGRHYFPVSSSEHFVGKFNAHLRDCVVLFADEAFYAGDKKHESILKTLITEDMLAVEGKGVDVELAANCVHLIVASNEDWVVPAGIGDRRFFILKVESTRVQDQSYFDALDHELQNGGRGALLHYLLTFDLKGFDVRRRPKTRALGEEQEHSLTAEQDWWYSKLRDGQVLPKSAEWPEFVLTDELLEDFVSNSRKWPGRSSRSSKQKLANFLARVIPGGTLRVQLHGKHTFRDSNDRLVEKERPYAYRMPSLDECRAHWNKNFDTLSPWEKPELIGRQQQEVF